ncbi:MAG: 50S ribosomal protein L21 [Hyphomonadaceae bacterium]
MTLHQRFLYIAAPRPRELRADALEFWKTSPMFAVIKTGGKQYRVAKDDVIVVEKLAGDAGAKVTFSDVLMTGDGKTVKLGKDLSGITVMGTLVETSKGEKVTVFKKRRRNTYRRKNGHRQLESHVKITAIGSGKE